MKKNKILTGSFALALAAVLTFGAVGCTPTDDSSSTLPENSSSAPDSSTPDSSTPSVGAVTVSLGEAEKETLSKGDSVKLTATVENATDKTVTWSVSDDTVLSVTEDGVVTMIGDITLDKYVTVTATSNADPSASVSKTFLVKAPIIEGQVGELTTAMIQEIAAESITVTGTLTDVYVDYNQASNNSTQAYDMTVTMAPGAWSGSWNIKGNTYNVVTDNYRRGETDGVKDQYGNIGHALEELYINKYNEVASTEVKDYISVPAVWEAQHLWNHLGSLSINKFEYDPDNEVYRYNIDETNEDDLYLMTYLSYSLTPMLSDTLMSLYLKVENGHITTLYGQTEVLYYGDDTNEDPDAMSYTQIEVSFSDIGTTVVAEPAPYERPEYADKLEAALESMGDAHNYTFKTVDTTTYSPSIDSGDYSYESTSSAITTMSANTTIRTTSVHNNTSSVGTVGCVGYVTEEAILFQNTIQYTYTMDGNSYRTEYTGYKQNDDDTYDEFAYDSTTQALYGTKKVKGNIFDSMPTFDFSADIFKFSGMAKNNQGVATYTFVLNATAVTRDVAMEVSAYKYAGDASPSASNTLTIVVDENGNLISTIFPYSLVSGTYMGYCTTTYSKIGTTTLDEDLFDGYTPRAVKNNWSDYTVKYYSANHSTLDSHDEEASVVLDAIYGDAVEDLPAPSVLMEILGDNIYGPFYDWREKGTDADGNPIYADFISITATSSEYDENSQITNYEELIAEIGAALEAEGFALSVANTDTSGGASGRADRYVCYIKGDIQIVIQNNFTRYFWIYFYKTGDWTLKR